MGAVSLTVLSACERHDPPAPVTLKGHYYYDRSQIKKVVTQALNEPMYAAADASLSAASMHGSDATPAPAATTTARLDAPVAVDAQALPPLAHAADTERRAYPNSASTTSAPAAKETAATTVRRHPPVHTADTPSSAPTPKRKPRLRTASAAHRSDADAAPAMRAGHPAPFIWPLKQGRLLADYGDMHYGITNDGVNIAAAEGTPIHAAAAGKVVYIGNTLKGYGNIMLIRHNDDITTAYAHARDWTVSRGQRVTQGHVIGHVGQSGAVDTAQLHFSIRRGVKPLSPYTYLPRRSAAVAP